MKRQKEDYWEFDDCLFWLALFRKIKGDLMSVVVGAILIHTIHRAKPAFQNFN